jgi:NAD(P)-dependent dehydrogenase (short-subunit alcohol dehydrogenase family)
MVWVFSARRLVPSLCIASRFWLIGCRPQEMRAPTPMCPSHDAGTPRAGAWRGPITGGGELLRLNGRVSIVTGAGRGIGRGIALRLAEDGADVVVIDILPDEARETARLVEALGRRSVSIVTDVSRGAPVAEMVARAVDAFGEVHILVNNAGVFGSKPLLDVTEEDWDRLMAVNLKGPFLCSQAIVRHFLDRGIKGRIINIASVESAVAFPDSPHYSASKGGVAMLTKSMAFDLAPYGITVNAIGPGTTDTGRNYLNPERRASYQAIVPLGRLATPRDIGHAAAFLASDEAEYITGHLLFVDGGLLTYKAPAGMR